MLVRFFTIALLTSFGNSSIAQDCFTLIKLKGGQQYLGTTIQETDSIISIKPTFIGNFSINKKEIRSQVCLDTNYQATVILLDETKITGIFLSIDSSGILVRNDFVKDKIPTEAIASITFSLRLEGIRSDVSNPNSTRYFFAPSAIPIEKGEGYYQNAYLLVNSANFGVTKNFSLGGGVAIPILFYITPKLSFKVSKNLYAGAGLIYTTTFLPDMNFGAGIPYGLVTLGNNERNVTIGSGFGMVWIDKEMQTTPYPITTLNGMFRISNKIQLVTENWIIPVKIKEYEDVYVTDPFGNQYWEEKYLGEKLKNFMAFSLGSRFVFSEKSSVDFAPVILTDGSQTFALPYLDFVYKF